MITDLTSPGCPGHLAADAEIMQRHCEQTLTAVSDDDLVGALDADEAMPETLYRASEYPVLTDLIRSLRSASRRIQTLPEKQRASASEQD